MKEVIYRPIGIIHSPFRDISGAPIQSAGGRGVKGRIDVESVYAGGLRDLDGFSHIILIYHFHLSRGFSLEVRPFMDENLRGVFSTRAPNRPNPIGLSIVRLTKVEGPVLYIEDLDIVDGTPLLDIKPYVPEFDVRKPERRGWLTEKASGVYGVKADERFK